MRTERLGIAPAVVALGMLALSAAPLGAQDNGQDPEGELPVFEREVYEYPAPNRRDPFLPLNAGERIGPTFDDLRLTGVLFNPAVSSVATLTDQKTRRRYRVREGDRLGEARILEIRPREVVFLITSYGISRREVLRVKQDKEQQG